MAELRIGIDTGGTFTDVARLSADGLHIDKLPSTPGAPERAVLDGLARNRGSSRSRVDLVHGSTVALNAILTRRLAKTAFVTNEGFRDLIEVGRQERRQLYSLEPGRSTPPIPRALRHEISQRRSACGKLLLRPTQTSLAELRERLRRQKVEAIAIGLLHSHGNPEDEIQVACALRGLGVPITCSALLAPVSGEFERFATAILNASVQPLFGGYVQRLAAGVAPGRIRLMRSSGGILSAEEAADGPAKALFSGPAGGVRASESLAHSLGFARAATLDMGGTSTDVALVGGRTGVEGSSSIDGLPLAVPAVDVHTVGCGGGSLASADAGGALRVGPASAGADPGPACYGKGDQPTVTDAHVALGHLGAETLLGGGFPIQVERSVRAVETLARRLGIAAHACAEGILEVAETEMMRALMVISVQRKIDPANLPLVAFGGAGGLHAAALVTRLGMPFAVIPPHPGAWSAVGLALAGESQELEQSIEQRLDRPGLRQLETTIQGLRARAREHLESGTGRAQESIQVRLRFRGQGTGLWLPWQGKRGLEASFRSAHHEVFGFAPGGAAVEAVQVRARMERPPRALPRPTLTQASGRGVGRSAPLRGAGRRWTVWQREQLPLSQAVSGPILVEEGTSVTRVPPGFAVRRRPQGLILAAEGAGNLP